MEKWKIKRIIIMMSQNRYLNKLKMLSEPVRQFSGLVTVMVSVILSFAILNIFFGQGDELVAKMKKEEVRIAEANKLSKLISTLPSGLLVFYEGTDHYKLSEELYETVCNVTKLIPQRAVMGANLTNFKAKQIYTNNGNLIDETFVKWDKEKNKCIAGFVLSGSLDSGENEKIIVSGEVLNFLSTGIDTRVYFIKNF
jgi:hypothetical protein